MNCICGHPFAAHQEITTPKGFAAGECCGEDTCTCSYYEPDQGDQ